MSNAAATLEVRRAQAPVSQRAAILARVGEARTALTEVETVEEAIRIAGCAEAVRHAARQARAGLELENAAMALRLSAERRAGGLLALMEKNKGAAAGGTKSGSRGRVLVPRDRTPKLADLGVSKRESSTYQQVAAVPEKVFEAYVAAPSGRLSRNALMREAVRAGQYVPVAPPPLPKGRWNLVLADPPWRYAANSTLPAYCIECHYPTLSLEEICALEVPAADDAVLFLWATAPKLPDALQVMAAWGFTYRTNAVWVKHRPGLGYYFRGRHELLLVGRRGDMPVPAPSDRADSVIEARRRGHSEKPDVVYELLERMYPAASKLELFARSSRPGWDRWGWDVDQSGDADDAARLVTPEARSRPTFARERIGLDFTVGLERVMCR